jgi:hypothetical protein
MNYRRLWYVIARHERIAPGHCYPGRMTGGNAGVNRGVVGVYRFFFVVCARSCRRTLMAQYSMQGWSNEGGQHAASSIT